MHHTDRFKLFFGPYKTPQFKYGAVVFCELHGEVKIVGMTTARIQWPKCRAGKAHAMILFGALAEAVRRESAHAVAHWWGVGMFTVWKWRKALGVPKFNEGTRRLKREYAREPWFLAAQKKAWKKARDPERIRKIAESKLGKPRPPHVIEAVRAANLGKKLSKATRSKMSLAHKRLGTRPPKAGHPWAKWEDRLVQTLRPPEVAKRTGRTLLAVYGRRLLLGLPDGRRGRIIGSALRLAARKPGRSSVG